MFLMFNSLDDRVDITDHPKYNVIFNNVSLHGEVQGLKIYQDSNKVENDESSMSTEERINAFKQ